MTAETRTETYTDWPSARKRLEALRAAGYRGTAVDMGAHILLRIALGKQATFANLPQRLLVGLALLLALAAPAAAQPRKAHPFDINGQAACDSYQRMARAYNEGLYPSWDAYWSEYHRVLTLAARSNDPALRQIVGAHTSGEPSAAEQLTTYCATVRTFVR
jgi:hypothetical protein